MQRVLRSNKINRKHSRINEFLFSKLETVMFQEMIWTLILSEYVRKCTIIPLKVTFWKILALSWHNLSQVGGQKLALPCSLLLRSFQVEVMSQRKNKLSFHDESPRSGNALRFVCKNLANLSFKAINLWVAFARLNHLPVVWYT